MDRSLVADKLEEELLSPGDWCPRNLPGATNRGLLVAGSAETELLSGARRFVEGWASDVLDMQLKSSIKDAWAFAREKRAGDEAVVGLIRVSATRPEAPASLRKDGRLPRTRGRPQGLSGGLHLLASPCLGRRHEQSAQPAPRLASGLRPQEWLRVVRCVTTVEPARYGTTRSPLVSRKRTQAEWRLELAISC